ncbi:MAG: hypothetical protein AB8H79_03565 [Myxococcota bacterium]
MASTGSSLLAGARAQIERLPPRSRNLLGILLILLGIVWMAGLWWYTSTDLAGQEEDLAGRNKTLQQLQLKQVQYKRAEEMIASAEQRLGAQKQVPSSYIETKASEHGVREMLRSIDRLASETRGSLKETRYRVQIQKAPLKGTLALVHDIETAGFMVTENVSYKRQFVKGERMMTSTIDLVAYELVKE